VRSERVECLVKCTQIFRRPWQLSVASERGECLAESAHARPRAHAHTSRVQARTHARTHTRTHARTQTKNARIHARVLDVTARMVTHTHAEDDGGAELDGAYGHTHTHAEDDGGAELDGAYGHTHSRRRRWQCRT
jgi:hypothetical protein